MKIQPGIATRVSGIFLSCTNETNFLCWYQPNLYYDTALGCYRGLWNLGNCFGGRYLVFENLLFCITALLVLNYCRLCFCNFLKRPTVFLHFKQVVCIYNKNIFRHFIFVKTPVIGLTVILSSSGHLLLYQMAMWVLFEFKRIWSSTFNSFNVYHALTFGLLSILFLKQRSFDQNWCILKMENISCKKLRSHCQSSYETRKTYSSVNK